jgi:hypothetical protein
VRAPGQRIIRTVAIASCADEMVKAIGTIAKSP